MTRRRHWTETPLAAALQLTLAAAVWTVVLLSADTVPLWALGAVVLATGLLAGNLLSRSRWWGRRAEARWRWRRTEGFLDDLRAEAERRRAVARMVERGPA